MLSLCTKYWEALLAQAFVIGIGAGCLFVPSVGILSTYFTTKIASAVGIAASGSSLGGVIYPIVFYRLQPRIGFPWTVRVIGFMALGMLAIPCAVMKMRVKPAAKRKLWDLQAFKEIPYASFVFGGFLAFVGLYVVFFYVSYYVEATRIGDEEIAFYQLPILNAASILGRVSSTSCLLPFIFICLDRVRIGPNFSLRSFQTSSPTESDPRMSSCPQSSSQASCPSALSPPKPWEASLPSPPSMDSSLAHLSPCLPPSSCS